MLSWVVVTGLVVRRLGAFELGMLALARATVGLLNYAGLGLAPALVHRMSQALAASAAGEQTGGEDGARILSYATPRQLITTNLGGLGWANRFNRQKIAADLDIISWDEYLGAGWFDNTKNGTGHLEPLRSGATHDLVRGWKQRNFWVLEMPPGFVDWSSVSNSLE